MKNKNKIVWISSYPKSGNTWIRVALNLALTGHLNLNKIQILKQNNDYLHLSVVPLMLEADKDPCASSVIRSAVSSLLEPRLGSGLAIMRFKKVLDGHQRKNKCSPY